MALSDDLPHPVSHVRLYWHERLPHLENTLQKPILNSGIPEILHIDSGRIFSALQINTICAEPDIRKITCQPYNPESKSKIARFFRTMHDRFLTKLGHNIFISSTASPGHLPSAELSLRALLEEEYHRQVHPATNQSPATH